MGADDAQESKNSSLNSSSHKEDQWLTGGHNNETLLEVLNNSQLSNIMERLSKKLEGAENFKSLVDATSNSLNFDSHDVPHLSYRDYITPNYTIPDLSTYTEGYRTNWQQLIIIGNGFDLQCGLRSSFGDFFKPRHDAIACIPDCKRETWRKLVDETDLTLWDFILEADIDSRWCGIEGTIERWVLSAGVTGTKTTSPFNRAVELFESCPFTDDDFVLINGQRESEQDDEGRMYKNIARYVWTLRPEFATDGYDHASFMAILQQELFNLEYAFGKYLANEVKTNKRYAEKCETLYRAIERDGKKTGDNYCSSTSVLSFNYTDLAEEFFDGGDDGVFVNIHGKLGGEIVFGIDGKDCMDNPNALSFTKTFRLMRRGGTRTDKLIRTANSANLNGATDVIKFYGHSLGKADYSYFQSLFDGVDLYESKTVLVFYYPYDSSDEKKNNDWRNKLANLINDLLVAYGATMDNKDHGQNLMHKLLLEGRLILRGVRFG